MNPFEGKSSLRPKTEEAPPPTGPSQGQLELQAYLDANYASKPPKKKKKKPQSAVGPTSLRIVDNDISGFAPVEETIQVKVADPDAPAVVDVSEAAILEQLEKKKKKQANKGTWHTVEDDSADKRGDGAPMEDAEDLSPPRRPNEIPPAATEVDDMSPPRRDPSGRPDADPDLSPPRRPTSEIKTERDLSPPRRPQNRNRSEKKRMMDGSSTGVVSSEQLKVEAHKKRRQDKDRLYEMDDHATGRGAETVYRNKQGQRVTLEQLEKERAKERKKVKWEKVEWDSGLVQQLESKRYKAQLDHERAKPFARGRDDEDLDAMYRARRRWGDPMGHLDKKQRSTNPIPELAPVINETNRHWFEKSGFVIPQEIPDHSWIRRGAAALSNRYNIRPGRHWDGVDRSNGFEKEYAKYLNECAARDKEAAQWCMEDM